MYISEDPVLGGEDLQLQLTAKLFLLKCPFHSDMSKYLVK